MIFGRKKKKKIIHFNLKRKSLKAVKGEGSF